MCEVNVVKNIILRYTNLDDMGDYNRLKTSKESINSSECRNEEIHGKCLSFVVLVESKFDHSRSTCNGKGYKKSFS
jgi:hypothetical protein